MLPTRSQVPTGKINKTELDIDGVLCCVGGQGDERTLYLLFNYAVNLKLLSKVYY